MKYFLLILLSLLHSPAFSQEFIWWGPDDIQEMVSCNDEIFTKKGNVPPENEQITDTVFFTSYAVGVVLSSASAGICTHFILKYMRAGVAPLVHTAAAPAI